MPLKIIKKENINFTKVNNKYKIIPRKIENNQIKK